MSEPEKPPAKLYRYYRASEHSFDVLENNRFYLPSPSSFNDPFDCRIPVSFEATRAKIERKLEFINARLQKQQIRAMRRDNYKQLRDQLSNDLVQDVFERFGVVCLCESPADLLMWAHYANCHTGFCLEFETAKDPNIRRAWKVRYSDEYPELNYFTTPRDDLRMGTVLWKSRHWSYEKEWRLAWKLVEGRSLKFAPESLTAVVIGCKAAQETIARIRKAVAARESPTALLQACVAKKRFALDIEPLP